ncbi:MAG: FecR domain-containing protein [Deltaproteobacteria bacterium]|nr:FecR domain-containing protein [Deltaproteobacteria bacterium]
MTTPGVEIKKAGSRNQVDAALRDIFAANADGGALGPADDLTKRRMIDCILDAAADQKTSTHSNNRRAGENAWRIWMVGIAAVAAAVLAVIWIPIDTTNLPPVDQKTESKPVIAKLLVDPDAKPPTASFSLLSGEVLLDEEPVGLDSSLNKENRVKTGAGRAIVDFKSNARLSLSQTTTMIVHQADEHKIEIGLKQGLVWAAIDPNRAGPRFLVITPHGKVTVTGTVFSVNTDSDYSVVRVLRGKVRVTDGLGNVRLVGAGEGTDIETSAIYQLSADQRNTAIEELVQSGLINENEKLAFGFTLPEKVALKAYDTEKENTTPRMPECNPGPLLKEIQTFRIAGRWSAVATNYKEIIDSCPHSSESRAAIVALAQVRLTHLNEPSKALALFKRYLNSGSAELRQEAWIGKSEALGMLGLIEKEKEALERFLKEHPTDLHGARARKRLSQISDREQ